MNPSSADDAYRHPWELIASQYLDGLRDGETPSIDEMAASHPDDARQIKEILHLVSAMEGWKTRRELSAMRQSMPESFRFERLGDCRILREIGRGGMGVVFEAFQQTMDRHVAVKVLPWRFPKSSRLRERFQHEACLAAKLRHKHIVPVYQFGEQDGWCYYVMHLVPGMGLDRVLTRLKQRPCQLTSDEISEGFQNIPRTPIGGDAKHTAASWWKWVTKPRRQAPSEDGWVWKREAWSQIARFGLQVAEALRYAHASGILHRDIKPGNLILDGQKRLWVADFGLAQVDDGATERNSEQAAGTLRYTAPEQLAGIPDARSDLYSLGVTLYEMCTLQPAFPEKDRVKLVRHVREQTPRSPQNLNSRCPGALSQIIMQAIAKDPADRFQSASEFMTALLTFLKSARSSPA